MAPTLLFQRRPAHLGILALREVWDTLYDLGHPAAQSRVGHWSHWPEPALLLETGILKLEFFEWLAGSNPAVGAVGGQYFIQYFSGLLSRIVWSIKIYCPLDSYIIEL